MTTAGLFSMLGGGDGAAMQRQLDDQRAQAFAQQTQEQRLAGMGYKAGAGLGRGIAGAFGVDVTDPTIRQAAELRRMASEYDVSSPEGLMQMAQALRGTNPQMAVQLAEKAQSMMQTQSVTAKNLRERAAADPFQKLMESGKYTPASLAKYQQSGKTADLEMYEKPSIESKSEFERILSSLELDPAQEKLIKQQWVKAKLDTDSSGLKGLQAQLLQTQIEQKQAKLDADKEKSVTEKTQAVSKLSSTESNIDTALNTAEKALKLAPNSLAGGLNQAVSSAIPWTDSKALSNLVGSLNSEKAIGTLEELKSQSRTGATGFGALSEKELALILNKTRALDPTDKLFKENLGVVMDGWSKIRNQVRESRLNLQGKKEGAGGEDLIARTMKANPGKTREQVTQKLKDLGKL